jgi:5'-3' exoribonuclease 1
VNLGLNLKFEAKKLKVLGYSRRGDSGWEFSEKAIQLVRQYLVKFPDFIAAVQARPKGDIYVATDLYPENEALGKIKEIQAWLKEIESKSFEKVSLDAEQLDSEVVVQIEKAADASAQQYAEVNFKKLKNLPRNALLLPADAEHRLGNQSFAIGHRVVYVQDSGKVPIASRGTVVGMTRTPRATLLDVVFDGTFMSGTTLNDRCSPFRGQTIPTSSVLNLTQRQLTVGSRANMERQKPQHSMPLTARGYGMPGGRGQMVPASASPPLQGSFRGAIAGGNSRGGFATNGATNGMHQNLPVRNAPVNGTRGRGPTNGSARGARGGTASPGPRAYAGNAGRGGANSPAPNGNAQPKSYNNVPPPPNIDASARGRGRGRGGRARGETSRARGTGRGRGRENVQTE